MQKKAPQARFFDENIAPQAKIMEQIAPQARFFLTESYCVICPVDVVYNLLFTNHSSESSFFN